MMSTVLWLLAIQGVVGAFDTFYFHEWRARLPAGGAQTAPELKLHACRSFLYAAIFAKQCLIVSSTFWLTEHWSRTNRLSGDYSRRWA